METIHVWNPSIALRFERAHSPGFSSLPFESWRKGGGIGWEDFEDNEAFHTGTFSYSFSF
jgi:hypothetical protein